MTSHLVDLTFINIRRWKCENLIMLLTNASRYYQMVEMLGENLVMLLTNASRYFSRIVPFIVLLHLESHLGRVNSVIDFYLIGYQVLKK